MCGGNPNLFITRGWPEKIRSFFTDSGPLWPINGGRAHKQSKRWHPLEGPPRCSLPIGRFSPIDQMEQIVNQTTASAGAAKQIETDCLSNHYYTATTANDVCYSN